MTLAPEDVRRIRIAYARAKKGGSPEGALRRLAKRYKITVPMITSIINGGAWKTLAEASAKRKRASPLVTVFALVDPRYNNVRYLDVAADLESVIRALSDSATGELRTWIEELKSLGLYPDLRILERGVPWNKRFGALNRHRECKSFTILFNNFQGHLIRKPNLL